MNNKLSLQQSEPAPATLNMTITPFIEGMLKDAPFFLEIEMLQGERRELPGGLIYYQVTIDDPQKQDVMIEFMLKAISNSHMMINN